MTTTANCPDCGTGIGVLHRRHCYLASGCEDHDEKQAAWTGDWPVGVETFDEAKKRWDQLIGLESTVEGSDLIYRSPMGFPLALANLYRFKGRFHANFGHPYGIQQNWLRENGEAR